MKFTICKRNNFRFGERKARRDKERESRKWVFMCVFFCFVCLSTGACWASQWLRFQCKTSVECLSVVTPGLMVNTGHWTVTYLYLQWATFENLNQSMFPPVCDKLTLRDIHIWMSKTWLFYFNFTKNCLFSNGNFLTFKLQFSEGDVASLGINYQRPSCIPNILLHSYDLSVPLYYILLIEKWI